MNKVYGIKEVSGVYQGVEFHNINLHTLTDSLDGVSHGQLCEVIKVKYSAVSAVFGKEMSSDDWLSLIGSNIVVGYDRYGRVNSIAIVNDK